MKNGNFKIAFKAIMYCIGQKIKFTGVKIKWWWNFIGSIKGVKYNKDGSCRYIFVNTNKRNEDGYYIWGHYGGFKIEWYFVKPKKNYEENGFGEEDRLYYSYFFSLHVALMNSNYASVTGRKDKQFGNVWPLFNMNVRSPKNTWKRLKQRYKRGDFSQLIPPIYKAIDIAREIGSLMVHSYNVCNDPMNGCPEDFAESFGREGDHLWYEFDKLKVCRYVKTYVMEYFEPDEKEFVDWDDHAHYPDSEVHI